MHIYSTYIRPRLYSTTVPLSLIQINMAVVFTIYIRNGAGNLESGFPESENQESWAGIFFAIHFRFSGTGYEIMSV